MALNHLDNHFECRIVNVFDKIHRKDETAGTSAEGHLVWSCLRVTLWWIRQSWFDPFLMCHWSKLHWIRISVNASSLLLWVLAVESATWCQIVGNCCLSARSWCENVLDRKHAVVIVPCDLCRCANTRGHIQLADSCLPSPHKYWTIHIHEHANTGYTFGCEWLTRREEINVH